MMVQAVPIAGDCGSSAIRQPARLLPPQRWRVSEIPRERILFTDAGTVVRELCDTIRSHCVPSATTAYLDYYIQAVLFDAEGYEIIR